MTIENVSQEDATKILRGLMYGSASSDYAHVRAAVNRRDDALAA
jgi:hypothetical protein